VVVGRVIKGPSSFCDEEVAREVARVRAAKSDLLDDHDACISGSKCRESGVWIFCSSYEDGFL
jgi:hypothetical protein